MGLKGKLDDFFLLSQSFCWAQTKRSLNWQFSPKSPKVGQKTGRSVKNWPNKTPFAFNLLWESTNSVIGAAVGIHQFLHPTCCGNPLFGNFSIRPTVGIHQFLHRSCCGNPYVYIIQSNGFPQQLRWQNWWIPTVGRMQRGSYLVNFWHFDPFFGPLWGFSVKIACWDFS